MDILIICHKPPGFGHPNLFKLNTNKFKNNKTRKNIFNNLKRNNNSIFYINTNINEKNPIKQSNFFSNWASIPDHSIDIIWSEHCPLYGEYILDELFEKLREGIKIIDEVDGIWNDCLIHAKRILKPGGKMIFPYFDDWIGFTSDSETILLITRLINMEVSPDYLYKLSYIKGMNPDFPPEIKKFIIVSKKGIFQKGDSVTRNMNVSDWNYIILELPNEPNSSSEENKIHNNNA